MAVVKEAATSAATRNVRATTARKAEQSVVDGPLLVKAIAKGVRLSPRKVAIVAALVRGRTVADALTILEHTPRRPAIAVSKVVASAKANAEHNHNLKPDSLAITEISVTAGPRLRRYRPAAHGRALPFQRKTSHIRVVVSGVARASRASATTAAATTNVKSKEA